VNNETTLPSSSTDALDHTHNPILDDTEADYLKSGAKRQKLYDNAMT